MMKALLMSFSERKSRMKTWQGNGGDKVMVSVLACLGCCNKVAQGGLTNDAYFCIVLEAGSLRLRCQES